MKLSDIAQQIGGSLEGNAGVEICGVASLREAGAGEISFVANPRYAAEAAKTRAGAVIVSENWDAECPAALIRTPNPDAAFAEAAMLFYTPAPLPAEGIHPSAIVAEDVSLGAGVRVGPLCVIEAGAKIGAGTVISAQCMIGHQVQIGENSRIYPQVSIREFSIIGSRTAIHNGAVIGSDGFGYTVDEQGVRTKVPQIGIVQIGDDVEIGANVTIDRARFGKTKIGSGVKIDNLVQIAHNVVIGNHSVIIAQSAVAGSATLGEKVIMAGHTGVVGHVHVGDGVIIGAKAAATKNIPPGEYLLGIPGIPAAKYKRQLAGIALLPKLKKRVIELEKQVALLQDKK